MNGSTVYIEPLGEKRRRIGLESAIKRRARSRYRIQINLGGPSEGMLYPACSLPFLCSTAAEAWSYADKVDPMKFFPNALSLSVEHVR